MIHDPVDTAQEFHQEYVGRHRRGEHWLFSRSRFRKSTVMDAIALVLLLITTALLGCAVVMLSTGTAKADTSDALAYAAEFGGAVCVVLDEYPSYSGIVGISKSIVENGGLSYRDAGAAIYYSVSDICPRHMPLLMRFAAAFVPHTPVAGIA